MDEFKNDVLKDDENILEDETEDSKEKTDEDEEVLG